MIHVPTVQNPPQVCTYTVEQLLVWKSLLQCAKDNKLFPEKELNAGLGTVISAVNRATNVCYFQNYLRITEPLINQIIATGQCQ
jgi:hypothetical protein